MSASNAVLIEDSNASIVSAEVCISLTSQPRLFARAINIGLFEL